MFKLFVKTKDGHVDTFLFHHLKHALSTFDTFKERHKDEVSEMTLTRSSGSTVRVWRNEDDVS